jgi:hypothetical protein
MDAVKRESLLDMQAGFKKIFLVMKTIDSQKSDKVYFREQFMQKTEELKDKIQLVFGKCVDRVYCPEDEEERRIGVISIQKSGEWKLTISERELLEKLGLDCEHWWALVPINHV